MGPGQADGVDTAAVRRGHTGDQWELQWHRFCLSMCMWNRSLLCYRNICMQIQASTHTHSCMRISGENSDKDDKWYEADRGKCVWCTRWSTVQLPVVLNKDILNIKSNHNTSVSNHFRMLSCHLQTLLWKVSSVSSRALSLWGQQLLYSVSACSHW